jgi:histone-lysine N-methyltransferase SETMAR
MSELNMRRVATKFVPRLLTPEQKEHRVTVCQDLRKRATDNPSFMSRIITSDKSRVYGYDPETKRLSSQWKSPSSPQPKKARMSRSSTKTMLIVFFDIRSIVHHEFVPQGQTVNKKFYCEVLRRLRENIWGKRSDLWRVNYWILHDDNAPCHRALLVREVLANHNMLSLPHPPYLPDLAPAYFFLFPEDEDAAERSPF